MLLNTRFRFGRRPAFGMILLMGLMAFALFLFVIGVVAERNALAAKTAPCVQQQVNGAGGSSGESAEAAAGGEGAETPTSVPCAESPSEGAHEGGAVGATTNSTEGQTERILGVAVDDPGVVVLIAFGWLVLIAGMVLFGRRVLLLVLAAAAIAVLFDVAEVVHQLGEQRPGIAALAALVALGHVAVVALAAVLLSGREIAVPAIVGQRLSR
jgi:hypothetical protein